MTHDVTAARCRAMPGRIIPASTHGKAAGNSIFATTLYLARDSTAHELVHELVDSEESEELKSVPSRPVSGAQEGAQPVRQRHP
jgi:hypothetical protein